MPATSLRLYWLLPFLMLPSLDMSYGQERKGNLGLGAQAGDPYGLTFRWYQNQQIVFDALLSWGFDGHFTLNAHQLLERRLEDSPLNFFIGPGILFGTREQPNARDLVLGVSSRLGVNFFSGDFEVFLHLTPRLNIIINPEAELGGGVGLRYFFRSRNKSSAP